MKKNIAILLILGLFGQIQAMEQYQITDIRSYGGPQSAMVNKLKVSLELKDTLFSSCTHFMHKDFFPAQSSDSNCPTCLNNRAKINNLSVREDFFNKIRDKITIALEKNNASEINITTLGGAHMGFEFILLHALNVTLQNKTINLINLEGGKHNLSNDYKRTIKSFFNNYFDNDNAGVENNRNRFNFFYYFNQTQEYLEHSKENTTDSLNILICLCLDQTPNSVDELSKMLFQNNRINENNSMSDSFSSLCENLPENSIVGLLASTTMTLCSLVGKKQDEASYNCNLHFENTILENRTTEHIEDKNYIVTRQFINAEELSEKENQITFVSGDDIRDPLSSDEPQTSNGTDTAKKHDADEDSNSEESSTEELNIPEILKDLQDNSLLTPKKIMIGTSIIALAVALYLGHNWIVENKNWYNALLHKIPFFKNN